MKRHLDQFWTATPKLASDGLKSMALVGIVPVGLTTAGLVFKLFGLTLEMPTSWTLDQMTPHLPSNPHSNLKDISKVRPASVPLEGTPFIRDKMTAPNFALSFPTCLSRKSWFRLLKIVFFEFQKSGINCFPFLPPPPSLQLPSIAAKRNDLEFCCRNFSATNGFKTDCEGGLAASVSGAIAFQRWNPKPLQPLPNFPSSTMMKPFRQR